MSKAQSIPEELSNKSEVRDFLHKALKRDIMGPSWKDDSLEENEHEVLELQKNSPYTYYFCGYISPAKESDSKMTDKDGENEIIDLLGTPEGERPPETFIEHSANSTESDSRHTHAKVANPGNSFSPRSIGLTIKPLNLEVHPINIKLSWGEYTLTNKKGQMKTWSRSPFEFTFEIKKELFDQRDEHRIEIPGSDGLELFIKRGTDFETITIRMVNNRVYPASEPVKSAEYTVHQPVIKLSSVFEEVRTPDIIDHDRSMALLYSESKIYAKGHNVGVNWEGHNEVWTEFLPSFEVPVVRADSELDNLIPSMKEFSEEDTVISSLNKMKQFMKRYGAWAAAESIRFVDYDPDTYDRYEDVFDNHMGHVKETISRIESGIEYLKNDEIARKAFTLSNKSIMISQTDDRLTDTYRIKNFKWRPFQICFQLLNVRGLLDSENEEKEIVDLAWFPTGGGKTEAYLGLIAINSFYRRLNPKTELKERATPGIHSIMRYTLRLLTADQSSRLVRACGAMNIVADKHKIGSEQGFTPFRVGMWIGSKTSPNNLFPAAGYNKGNTAQDVIEKANQLEESGDCTVVQFPTCPWCGDSSVGDASRYEITTPENTPSWANKKPIVSIKCVTKTCPFNEGVPFTCVDEDIYLNPPSILLGTADKFAQLSFNHFPKSVSTRPEYNLTIDQLEDFDARRMMGFATNEGGPLPPSLVIQDELHLLTGPLGTIAGLVECALDLSWKYTCNGHRVKYVAATATIRGAENDASLMYGRGLNIFPAPLLTIKDNFFAKEISKEDERGRLHVGIIAPQGKSRTLLNHPSASLLQNVSSLRQKCEVSDEDLDPYWTLVLYYNSLRELGGGQSSLRKNIPQMIRLFARQSACKARELKHEEELTSRKTGEELSLAKERLEFQLPSDKVVDVVSTSNMFQVGIDIGRLGIMSIVGQPRSNSEYIQSSGRVGRKHPGMVVSLLKGNYPRDQSHYELFRAFHQEIYSHVDHTSITPFSQRALDRAFPSTMMLLLRSSIKKISKNKNLNRLMNGDCKVKGDEIIDLFVDEIRRRQTLRGMSEQIISESEKTILGKWDRLKNFVKNARDLDRVTWWIVWNDRQRSNMKQNAPLSWLKSSFRITHNPNNEDYEDGLSSFRDVADEAEIAYVPYGNDTKPYASGSMPESHLFSHMAPGHIWEKGGIPYLTLGISRWNNDISISKDKKIHMAAFNSKNDSQLPGLRITEPALNQILGVTSEGKQRMLRCVPPYKDGNKQYGSVNVTKYPFNYICEDGHVHYGVEHSKEGPDQCLRAGCSKATSPSRFVSICDKGHLSPFDYQFWAHANDNDYDKDCRKPGKTLVKLIEGENSGYTLADWVVECEHCGAKNSMERVTWVDSNDKRFAPLCNGHRPWLASGGNAREKCEERMVHRQVGNVSVSYSQGSSVLLIPPDVSFSLANNDNIQMLLKNARDKKQSFDEFCLNFEQMRQLGLPTPDLSGTYFDGEGGPNYEKFLKVLWDYSNKHSENNFLTLKNLRGRERNGIIDNDVKGGSIDLDRFDKTQIAGNFGDFPRTWESEDWPLKGATRVNRLTELKYIYGVDRLDPKESNNQPIDHPDTRGNNPDDEFGIGMYNFGEGLYFDIKPDWLSRITKQRNSSISEESHRDMLFSNDERLRNVKQQIPALEKDNTNNSAFTILHTFSHLLIKELAQSSGFSLGSIRERLYFDVDENKKISQCGILLYTSGPSSDGTLGGLVRRGSSRKKIDKLIQNTLLTLQSCSNDPVCSDHEPNVDEPNGAACHSCILLPETSCEFANHLLDRNWG